MDDLSGILASLQSQQHLTREQMSSSIGWLLSGDAQESQMRAFLELLVRKGETVDELAGAADALRASMRRIDAHRRPVVDTCGTGGDGSKTFNISTAAAMIVAACGVSVAKHGNRKITSRTGSADVLAELGINLSAAPEVAQRCLRELGVCFCFAPHFHPAMKHVAEARKAISQPTIFNRLGPLANPAGADRQVLGVGAESLVGPMAEALRQLGTTRSIVVRGEDGVDEVSISAATRVLHVRPDGIDAMRWHPADFGLQIAEREALFADDPASSAACIRSVLAGDTGPQRDVVLINAAAALWIAGTSEDLRRCTKRAAEAIDSGDARRLVERLGQLTNET